MKLVTLANLYVCVAKPERLALRRAGDVQYGSGFFVEGWFVEKTTGIEIKFKLSFHAMENA